LTICSRTALNSCCLGCYYMLCCWLCEGGSSGWQSWSLVSIVFYVSFYCICLCCSFRFIVLFCLPFIRYHHFFIN